jgi:hypothetical protein
MNTIEKYINLLILLERDDSNLWQNRKLIIIIIIIIINSHSVRLLIFLHTSVLHNPLSIIANLHMFLSFSYSFQPVAICCLSYRSTCFDPLWKKSKFRTACQKWRYVAHLLTHWDQRFITALTTAWGPVSCSITCCLLHGVYTPPTLIYNFHLTNRYKKKYKTDVHTTSTQTAPETFWTVAEWAQENTTAIHCMYCLNA